MSREATIRVENRTLWLLGRIVKAHNSKLSQAEVPLTIDGFADDLLMQWIKANKPKLIELMQRREALNEEALTL